VDASNDDLADQNELRPRIGQRRGEGAPVSPAWRI
jgi:hypothetical protein